MAYYLCDCCKNTDNQDDEAIYICQKCGKQICNACIINLQVGEAIPFDYQHAIAPQYCPFCGEKSMVEILAGNMDNYFLRTGIIAKKTWEGSSCVGEIYQVWELSKDGFEKLSATIEKSYQDGEWWRSSEGSNMGEVNRRYKINGRYIKAWDGTSRQEMEEENKHLPVEDRLTYQREYKNLAEYFCDEIGASQPRNICALAVDLAKQNKMTMAELFRKYNGYEVVENVPGLGTL